MEIYQFLKNLHNRIKIMVNRFIYRPFSLFILKYLLQLAEQKNE